MPSVSRRTGCSLSTAGGDSLISISEITESSVNLVPCEAIVGLINNYEIAHECTPECRDDENLHSGDSAARVVDVVDRVDGIFLVYLGGYHVVTPRIGDCDHESLVITES